MGIKNMTSIHFRASDNSFHMVFEGGEPPVDSVPISQAEHRALLAQQAAGAVIQARRDGRPQAIKPDVTLSATRVAVAAAIKREAERRILEVAPLWRQSNDAAALAMHAVELANGEPPSADVSASVERRRAIDAIRSASDRLESAITKLTKAALQSLDVAAPEHWPA